ncbi:MAG: acetate--CoA ligase, partial [Thermomicrobiales bacterium]|nr:acetate--CoA ligase [Thermomicrobiales bacterium]
MPFPTITKSPSGWRVQPNLIDYERTRAAFDWADIRRELDGLPDGGGLNIAHEAVDRHLATPRRDHLAIRWLGKRGDVRDFTYAEL